MSVILVAALVFTVAVGEIKLKNTRKSIIQAYDKLSESPKEEKPMPTSSTKDTNTSKGENTIESLGISTLTYNSIKEKEGIEETC